MSKISGIAQLCSLKIVSEMECCGWDGYLEVEGQDDCQRDDCGEEDVDDDVLLEPLNIKVIFSIVVFFYLRY